MRLKTMFSRRCPTRVFPCAARNACGACDTACGTGGAAENSATAVMTHAASIHSLPRTRRGQRRFPTVARNGSRCSSRERSLNTAEHIKSSIKSIRVQERCPRKDAGETGQGDENVVLILRFALGTRGCRLSPQGVSFWPGGPPSFCSVSCSFTASLSQPKDLQSSP